MSSPRALPALFCGALAISFAPILVRLSETGPVATAFWRIALALPVLWLWSARRREASDGASLRLMALAGLFFAADLGVWHWSITLTSVANSTLLVNLAPVFVTLGAYFLFGERVGRGFGLALAVALAGAAILVGGSHGGLGAGHPAGDALALLTALFYAGYLLSVSRLRGASSTARVMAVASLAAAPVLLLAALGGGEAMLPRTPWGWLVLAALALLCQVAGQGLITYALAHLPASFSSVGLLLQPVGATLLAWLILHEAPERAQLLGGVLVLAGIYAARRSSAPR